jgi:hypothetical protein
VRIGVTDTGEGMTPEVRNHAFDPFFTTKKRGLGTGLGLSLVRGVAQSAGGTVEIESAPGQGTTVVLGLPVVKERARAGSPSADAVVVVSIRDRRGASMVSTLLASQPLIIKTSRAAINEHSRLWIVDPGLTTRSEVNEYLRGDRRRRVVLFGKPEDEWTARRVLLIDDATNMDTIRRTLGEALSAIGGSQ